MSIRRTLSGIVWPDVPEDLILTSGDSELRIVAIHEAGHAVANLVCGFELKDVSIDAAYIRRRHVEIPDDEPLGFCTRRFEIPDDEPPGGISTPSREEVERDAMVTLAGGKAETWYTGDAGIVTHDESDDEYFRSLRPGDETPELLADWRRRMNLEAESLVRTHWREIEAVAQELLRRGGQLSGSEVQRIISAEVVRKSG